MNKLIAAGIIVALAFAASAAKKMTEDDYIQREGGLDSLTAEETDELDELKRSLI